GAAPPLVTLAISILASAFRPKFGLRALAHNPIVTLLQQSVGLVCLFLSFASQVLCVLALLEGGVPPLSIRS
ncbi:MAG: hypothetical protein ACXWC0_30175, partial [Burkholderiales bacterium]